jgi:uncharacterized glyoxalase superfamily protein PhnB
MNRNVVPMFHVPDVRKTVEWYRDIGFTVTATYGDGSGGFSFAMLAFGAGEVMFSAGGRVSTETRRDVDLYVYIDDVDALFAQIRDRIEIVEAPHNMFYGMREIIVRDLNGFWITFGQDVPADVLTPWPPTDAALLAPYAGRYTSDSGSSVVIAIHDGRLLAFPDESSGVFLRPEGDDAFSAMMSQPATVVFERGGGVRPAFTFAHGGTTMRFVRSDKELHG